MAEVGQVLAGRYRLVELLGQGGMATIFRGHDVQLGRDVAVKVLRAEYGRDPAFVARFRQEAQSAAALSHPYVVNVFDYGMEAGDPFIVMELIDGGDLASVIRERGAFDPVSAAKIAQQIYEALDAAHARGIVHRDIKPTNVLLTSGGRVKVADFGIARAFSEAQLTMPGTTLGSVHYFSPEQARGEMVTTASDVYSAGLVLFEMLTGQRAWTGDSAGAVAVARLAGDPPSPSSIKQGIPPILDTAVRRALARVPADRPTAGEMAAILGRFIADPTGPAAFMAVLPVAPPSPGVAAASTTAGVSNGEPPNGGRPPAPNGPAISPSPAPGPPSAGVAYSGARRGMPSHPPFPDKEEEDQQGSGPWGWIAAILGALVLFAGAVLLFLLLGNRTPAATPFVTAGHIAVPSFVGQKLPDAERQATSLGLIITAPTYQQTTTAPDGTVIAQDPAAGAMVGSGSQIALTVATQSSTVAVPVMQLRTEPDFFSLLAQSDLVPGQRTQAYDPAVPATLIVQTNPRSGVQVVRGTVVDYVVSLGPMPTPSPAPTPTITPSPQPTVPFTFFVPTPSPTPVPTPTPTPTPPPTPSPTPPPTPSPTPTLPPTPPPTPTPTAEPTPVTVGNYATCETLGQAEGEIQAAGLVVGVIFPSPENADPNSQVAQQYPNAGTAVPPGTEVHLYVKGAADSCP